MTNKLIFYSFIILLLLSYQAESQAIITNINNQVNGTFDQTSGIESIFTLSEMPKIQTDVEIIQDRIANVKATDKMSVVKLLVIIQVKDIISEKFITSKNFTFTGSGKTETQAVKNAFSKIKSGGENIRTFLEKTNHAVEKPSCDQAQSKINQWINEGKIKQVLQLANQIAFHCPQHAQIYDNTFNKIQMQNCEKYILNSKAYAANKEFEKAVREILKVDPSSNCSAKARKELETISKDYDIQADKLYSAYQSIGSEKQQYRDFIISLLIENKN